MPTPTKTKPVQRANNYSDHDWERVGLTLRLARESKNVTQAELATAIGFRYHSSVTQIERGIKPMTDEKLIAAAKFLGIDPIVIRRPLGVTR